MMKRQLKICALTFLLFMLGHSVAWADCEGRLGGDPSVREVVECVNQLFDRLDEVRSENLLLKREIVPDGAVIAFDRRDGCPRGWSQFNAGISRVIVGAGKPRSLPSGGVDTVLSAREFNEAGGEETVRLTLDQMPTHDHGGLFAGDGNQAGMLNEWTYHAAGYEQIRAQGGSQPHNNMPPFIALYYCKKG